MSQKVIELVEIITTIAEEYGALNALAADPERIKKLRIDFSKVLQKLKKEIAPQWGVSQIVAAQQQFHSQSQQAQLTATQVKMQALAQQAAPAFSMQTLQDMYDRMKGIDLEPELEPDIEIEFSL